MSSKKQEELKKIREEHKAMGIKRFFNSIKFSLDGLVNSYKNEQSMWLHAACSIMSIILCFALKANFYEWALILISLAVILAVELLNTGIEAVVDMVTKDFHPLAKVAKDCGSAASFVVTMITLAIELYIFIPKIIALF